MSIRIVISVLCMLMASITYGQVGENYKLTLKPLDKKSVLESEDYYTWGGSPIKGEDGLYHLFYSRWEKKYGFLAWVTHSEVAHAVSSKPLGPYRFHDVALPRRGQQYWDGMNTHNPTIHFFDGKYYLYYTGNTGDGIDMDKALNPSHRNNQRIGVAVSDSPYGPWERFDKPIIDVSPDSTAHDALMMANPSITKRIDGKGYLLVYKAVAKKEKGIWGGPVVHLCATSESPLGPFTKYPNPIFTAKGERFPAEDPYVWSEGKYYYAIVKDFKGTFTKAGPSLALFYSQDGINWDLAKNPLVSVTELHWKDGHVTKLAHLERPQLLIEKGKPKALFLAADASEDYTQKGHSYNVHIKLK